MVGKSAFVLLALVAVVAAQGNLRSYLNTMDFAEVRMQGLASRVTLNNRAAHHAETTASRQEHGGLHNEQAEMKALHASAASAIAEIDFEEAAQDNNQIQDSYKPARTTSGDVAATEAKRADVQKQQEEAQKAAEEGSKWKVVSSNWRDVNGNQNAAMDEIRADNDEMLLQEGDEYQNGIDFTKDIRETNIVPNEANRPAPQHPSAEYEKNLSKPLAKRPDYSCEICMMVMGRKIADSDELCGGLEHEDDRAICWNVVRALTAYDRYTIDWLYHSGCLRKTSSNKWMQTIPCPPHVLCSWMMWTNNNIERPFCQFFVTKYKRSEDFHKMHRLPLEKEEADQSEEDQKKVADAAAAGDSEEKNTTPTEANASDPGGAPESLDGMIPDGGKM